ncbi:hypothetical protein RIF29_27668 [Crotalaria pallida]|uniref:Uncharacterized protein n=1 Tax=Crotalaria pallida TaxID=3830 RepID=A0AAN9EPH7_CROPI
MDLSNNMLYGPIPATIGNLSSLTYLHVESNPLNGSLPMDLWQLSKLEILGIGYNSISGNLSEKSFTKLSNLKALTLDFSDFNFNFGTHWEPPFQLDVITISNCKVGISSSGLSFNGEGKFWSFVMQIEFLYLSNNSISGDLSTTLITNRVIDLHSNKIGGLLPRLSPKVSLFNIANNSFSGPIYTLLCQNITGTPELETLVMSYNLLFGELPDCWMHWPSLRSVNLESNNLTGTIPESIGSLIFLHVLRLRKNILYGSIPSYLKSCENLRYLDLAYNEFTGNIPSWISHQIQILILRSNKFNGSIPSQICQFSNLQALDLANNRLSGPLPNCLSNITSLVNEDTLDARSTGEIYNYLPIRPSSLFHYEDLPLFVKGQDLDYLKTSNLVRVLDFSNNDFSGSIPTELFSLIALHSLNLSHNHLTGKISGDIGRMRFLESLDLSSNLFSGEIPQNMSNLSFLGVLNLSYNNFSGRIPLGTQLQSFQASSYAGNLQLCGNPLPNHCTQEDKPNGSMEYKVDDDFKTSFQLGAGVGFASGFWGVCGTIFFIRKWRHAYFRTLENFHVIILIKVNHLLYGQE